MCNSSIVLYSDERLIYIISSCFLAVGTDTPYSALYKIAEIIRHPQYDFDKSLNDIALIKTQSYILFSRAIGVVCLPPPNEPLVESDILYCIYEFQDDVFIRIPE